MGLPIPIASEVQQGQIVLISNSAVPFPPCEFQVNQFSTGCQTTADCITVLWNQGGWVATDEMTFYLQRLQDWGLITTRPFVVQGLADLRDTFVHGSIPSEGENRDPVHCHKDISIHTTRVGHEIIDTSLPTELENKVEWHVEEVRSHFPYDCRFQAFAWLQGYASGNVATPMTVVQAESMRTEFEPIAQLRS